MVIYKMGSAKNLIVKPIRATDANRIIRTLHYSGKTVPNSQVHLGVFMNGKCGGAIQFGPPLVKKNILPLVEGTSWNELFELNRMAFADWLPRNGESRCLGYAMRWLKKTYPNLKWIISFADGTQCGDGAIYRASGFVLTDIRKNMALFRNKKTGEQRHLMQFFHTGTRFEIKKGLWEPLKGYQFRYIYFLDPSAKAKLTVPIIPFSRIDELGVGMYKGQSKKGAGSVESDAFAHQAKEGGAIPTPALQSKSQSKK